MSQQASLAPSAHSRPLSIAAFFGAALLLLSAPITGAEVSSATAAKPGKLNLTDGNIAAIVVAANAIDVRNGQLALAKSRNADVQAFAKQMVADHTSVNKKATELATRLKLKPVESESSRTLEAGAAVTLATLDAKPGAEFDQAYVDNEVAFHRAVIDMLDETLIPGARNKDLKALLVNVRPAFVAHLEHAQRLQASLRTP